jgi:hypothetical protein
VSIDTKDMIFVFGSNLGGIHGAGAARFAAEHRGAKMGVGYGRTGQSYAIPTKGAKHGRVGATLPLVTINRFVTDFLTYAREHPELQFQITCIGCGLAGLKHENIASMFKDAPDNCWFDNTWFPYLTTGAGDQPQHRYWGTF